jgi:hypothetical protein
MDCTKRGERPNCMDCKVIAGECVVTQHNFLMADFHFQIRVRRDRGTKNHENKIMGAQRGHFSGV